MADSPISQLPQAGNLSLADLAVVVKNGVTCQTPLAGLVPEASFPFATFVGDGFQTQFQLPSTPASPGALQVYIGGVYQLKGSYTVAGQWLTLTEPAPLGASIEVVILGITSFGGNVVQEATLTQRAHRKKVAFALPITSANAIAAKAAGGYDYTYPQAFTIDFLANEILISRDGAGGANNYQWIEVFDLVSLASKRIFSYGGVVSQAIVVLREGSSRFLYAKHATGGVIGKYDITALPANLSHVSPVATFAVDSGNVFTFDRASDTWSVEQLSPSLTDTSQRNRYVKYNRDFSLRLGQFVLPWSDVGGAYYDEYFPKQQGMSQGAGVYVGSIGGYFALGSTPTPYNNHGVRVYSGTGELLAESVMNPQLMANILEANGHDCSRMENEGSYVSEDGRIFSMTIVKGNQPAASSVAGILLLEEFSNDADSIDFSPAAVVSQSLNRLEIEAGVFPRSGDKMYNPVTGALFTNWSEIMSFLGSTETRQFSYFTTEVPGITDINLQPVPENCLVTITKCNTLTYHVTVSSGLLQKRYSVYSSSPRIQVEWEEYLPNRTANLTWIALGDSITARANSYAYRAAGFLHLALDNRAVANSTMTHLASDSEALQEASFAWITAGLPAVDLITVAFGTNDATRPSPIGALGSTDADDFYGAMAVGYANILVSNPATMVVFILPPYRKTGDATLQNYRNAIIAFAASKNLPVISCNTEMGVNSANVDTYIDPLDAPHPTAIGQLRQGRYVAGKLSSLM